MIKQTITACIICLSSLNAYAALLCSGMSTVEKYDGHYYAITTNAYTFNNAKLAAKQAGGYLAVPTNAGQNSFIQHLVGGNKSAWIGIYDPNMMSNYCYSDANCAFNASRFRTVQGNVLTYSNWGTDQPDNLVEKYDIINGKPQVSPLGEHWVAINGNNGYWSDDGNHAAAYNNPIKFQAVIEFDKMPSCYSGDTNTTTTITTPECNTEIYNTTTQTTSIGKTYQCQQDKNNVWYCPYGLSPASSTWDYKKGQSVAKTGTKTKYTSMSEQYTCPYNGYVLSTSIKDSCPSCYDEIKNVVTCNTDGTENISVEDVSKSNTNHVYAVFAKRVINTQNVNLSVGRTYLGNPGQGCNFPLYYSRTCNTANGTCTHDFSLSGSTCNGRDYSVYNNAKIPYKYICASGYTPTGQTGNKACQETVDYTYYQYLCSGATAQGYSYIPQDTNGTSSTPPANNCKGQAYSCDSNDSTPVQVNGQWECSPFPCINDNNITNLSTSVGSSDKNNNGWNGSGGCNGTIYIFNGKSYQCRNWDMFGGLTGGGCCDKNKVFLGLVSCHAEEKLLANKRQDNLCHYVGNYCSKKLNLGFSKICIQKSNSYCCFNSILAKIIQEQGRQQLDMGWGSANNPQCHGFTPLQFSKLDLSQMNFSAFTNSLKLPNANNLGASIKNQMQAQLSTIKK